MDDNDPLLDKTLVNLKNIEAELFDRKRPARAAGGLRKAEAVEKGLDSWRLNQEVLEVKKECSALKYELDAARVLLTEQNVFTATSGSAMNALRDDRERLKKVLREGEAERCRLKNQLNDAEAELACLRSETARLKAEADLEKMRSAELRRKLEREASVRKELEAMFARGAKEPAVPEKAPAPTAPAPAPFRRADRPGWFTRGRY